MGQPRILVSFTNNDGQLPIGMYCQWKEIDFKTTPSEGVDLFA